MINTFKKIKYQSLEKSTLKTGDILLLKSQTFLGRLIRWFENSNYNHAGILIKIDEQIYISEADRYGIALTKFEDYEEKYGEIYILERNIKINKKQEKQLKEFILDRTGHYPYDFVSLIFRFPIRYIIEKLTGRKIWLQSKNFDKKFTCGEWVAYVIYSIFKDKWAENFWQISPADIYLTSYTYHQK